MIGKTLTTYGLISAASGTGELPVLRISRVLARSEVSTRTILR
jgi:hypothetical protein